MRRMTAFVLAALAVGALGFQGCTDAGDPVFPSESTTPVRIMVTDMVGAWDNLHVNGTLTGDTPVALTQDGLGWRTTIQIAEAGTYAYGLYTDDGTKALVEVRTGYSVTVSDQGLVTGDTDPDLAGNPAEGFRLVVTNNNTAVYDNIKIKGAYDGWASVQRDGQSDDGVTVWRNIPGGLDAGEYEWGVIHDDGSEWGIWLLPPGPNLKFTVGAETVTGELTFEIASPQPETTLTLNCDMNDYAGTYTLVQVRGTFNGWDNQPTNLSDPDEDGIYSVTLDVEQNATVIFKFLLDGATYESVPSECGLDDGYGGFNRSIEMGTDAATYSAPFGACPASR